VSACLLTAFQSPTDGCFELKAKSAKKKHVIQAGHRTSAQCFFFNIRCIRYTRKLLYVWCPRLFFPKAAKQSTSVKEHVLTTSTSKKRMLKSHSNDHASMYLELDMLLHGIAELQYQGSSLTWTVSSYMLSPHSSAPRTPGNLRHRKRPYSFSRRRHLTKHIVCEHNQTAQRRLLPSSPLCLLKT